MTHPYLPDSEIRRRKRKEFCVDLWWSIQGNPLWIVLVGLLFLFLNSYWVAIALVSFAFLLIVGKMFLHRREKKYSKHSDQFKEFFRERRRRTIYLPIVIGILIALATGAFLYIGLVTRIVLLSIIIVVFLVVLLILIGNYLFHVT